MSATRIARVVGRAQTPLVLVSSQDDPAVERWMFVEVVDAAEGAHQMGLTNAEFRKGLAEELPVEDGSIDVVISNGVINLCPDKEVVMREVHRVLKPGGRFQIADIIVHKEVPQSAKDNIDLWSG